MRETKDFDIDAFRLGHDIGFAAGKWFLLALSLGFILGVAVTISAIAITMAWFRFHP